MSDDWGLDVPPFRPEDALSQIKRALRDLKLAERGTRFELRGKPVVELTVAGAAIQARLARRLALTPEWDSRELKASPDTRKLIDEVKKRLARWDSEE